MAKAQATVRQSVSLPAPIAKRVRDAARKGKTSTNRVLVDLIEAGLKAREAERERFFALAERLGQAPDATERQRIKEELARMTFGPE
jgi:hypothetical protein